jgi:large subunit ribosomal protein L25
VFALERTAQEVQQVSSAQPVLKATSRAETGKAVAHLRKAGKIPAVVFGHGLASISVTLDAHEFELLRRTIHSNSLLALEVDGKDKHRVMVHGVQIDPRTRRLLHVDLFEIKSGEEVTVELPIRATGISFAVDRLGGTLLHPLDHVRVRALPEKLPEALEVSIEGLDDFEKAIYLRDLSVPSGVTVLADLDEMVLKVAPPHVVEEVAAPVEIPVEGEGEAEAGAEEPAAEAEPAQG